MTQIDDMLDAVRKQVIAVQTTGFYPAFQPLVEAIVDATIDTVRGALHALPEGLQQLNAENEYLRGFRDGADSLGSRLQANIEELVESEVENASYTPAKEGA